MTSKEAYPNSAGTDAIITTTADKLSRDALTATIVQDALEETAENLVEDRAETRRYVLKQLIAHSKTAKQEGTKLRALELLGKSAGLFTQSDAHKSEPVTAKQLKRESGQHLKLVIASISKAVEGLYSQLGQHLKLVRASTNKAAESIYSHLGLFVPILVLTGLLFFWFHIQIKSVTVFPPHHFNFIKKLASPPYAGSSFVVNNYAAPVAAYTQQWAYFDPKIGNALTLKDSLGKLKLIGDNKYLWFADKKTNEAYRRPDYFICIFYQTLGSAVVISQRLSGSPPYLTTGCNNLPIFKLASKPNNPFGLELAEMDLEGPSDVGYVRWAIIKFNWDKVSSPGLIWEP